MQLFLEPGLNPIAGTLVSPNPGTSTGSIFRQKPSDDPAKGDFSLRDVNVTELRL